MKTDVSQARFRSLSLIFRAIFWFAIFSAPFSHAETLDVDCRSPRAKASPILYGLMVEEINHSFDGGIYGELVRNRAFLDDPSTPAHWSPVGGSQIALDRKNPLNAVVPVSLKVESEDSGGGVANGGYWGIPIRPSTTYKLAFFARADSFSGPLDISLQGAGHGKVYAKARVPKISKEWKAYEASLTTGPDVKPTADARLAITLGNPGSIWLGGVSLFPPTWKDRANGLRPDLMKMLVDLEPRFLRFPGGNYLEGKTIDERFKWWETVGPISERPGHNSPWGYRSTDGMGLLEFLLWAEELGAQPIPALYAGFSLNGDCVKPGKDLEPFVQEALDEIEYIVGPSSSKWGAQRARDGHPEPFELEYVQIGNEDGFDKSGSYDQRFAQFSDAIKKRYPRLKCISSVGFETPRNKWVHSRTPDLVDEHYYRSAKWFIENAPTHYERYMRQGPKIFVGEWGAYETDFPPWNRRSKDTAPTPSMKAALGDAAWMAAMERNSDLVTMHCYAPTLVNVNGRQWRPNLIGFDALSCYGSPSYHAFRMFSTNLGDEILRTKFSPDSAVQGSATRESKSGAIFIKLVNPTPRDTAVAINLQGIRDLASEADVETLSASPESTNSLSEPTNVIPRKSKLNEVKTSFSYNVPANGIVVLELKAAPSQESVSAPAP
jgi:alpha-N-arabinofuranosidase